MERGEYIVDLTSVFDFYDEKSLEIKSKQFEQVLGCPLKEEIIRCKDCMFGNHEYGVTLLKSHVWCCDIERIRKDSEFCSRGVAWDGE